MGADTKIEWAHHTFNPWLGCTALSPACDHCFAAAWAKRTGQEHLWQGERRRTTESNWQQPYRWNRAASAAGERHRVFCGSLMDFADNQVWSRWRDDLWHVIARTPQLDWMLLTKRPQNIAKMLPGPAIGAPEWGEGWANVWLGTTVEDRARLRRVDVLREIPARIRFLSIEPLLEDLGTIDLWGIHLVIVGGESGPGARPMHPDWVRSIRKQCAAAGVAFFFKQWGEFAPEGLASQAWHVAPGQAAVPDPLPNGLGRHVKEGHWRAYRVGKKAAGRLLDGRSHDEMPVAA